MSMLSWFSGGQTLSPRGHMEHSYNRELMQIVSCCVDANEAARLVIDQALLYGSTDSRDNTYCSIWCLGQV